MRMTFGKIVLCAFVFAFAFTLVMGVASKTRASEDPCCLIPCMPPDVGSGNWGAWKKIGPQFYCVQYQDPYDCWVRPGDCAHP